MKKFDLLVTGVGGQGNILASDIIGEVALSESYDVKKTDTLGIAQRGGSVISHMRIAPQVYSPLIKEGEVNILLAFEKLEAARWCNYLQSGAIAIVNNYVQPPLSVNLGKEKYPTHEEINDILNQRTKRIYWVDGNRMAAELGNIRALNTLMLGCLSCFLPLKVATWKKSISQRLPAKLLKVNLTAFDRGRKEIQNVHI